MRGLQGSELQRLGRWTQWEGLVWTGEPTRGMMQVIWDSPTCQILA